jgi:undecaprenyl-diphosphatase
MTVPIMLVAITALFLGLATGYLLQHKEITQNILRKIAHKRIILLTLLFISLFFILTYTSTSTFVKNIDNMVLKEMQTSRMDFITTSMKLITYTGGLIATALISLAICLYFFMKKEKRKLQFFLLSLLLGELLIIIFKNTLQRVRPTEALVTELSYAFPSAHACISLLIAGSIYLLFYHEIQKLHHKYVFTSMLVLYPLLVGFSRIYLQVHWLSDVLAGWLLAMSILGIVTLGFKMYDKDFLIRKQHCPHTADSIRK